MSKSERAENRDYLITQLNDVLQKHNPDTQTIFAETSAVQNIKVKVLTKTGSDISRYDDLILTAFRAAGLISHSVTITSEGMQAPARDTNRSSASKADNKETQEERFLAKYAGKTLMQTTIDTRIKIDDFIQGKFDKKDLTTFEYFLTHPEEAHTVAQERAAKEREDRAESKRKLMEKKDAEKAAKKEAGKKKKPQIPDDKLQESPELKESKPRSLHQGRNGK